MPNSAEMEKAVMIMEKELKSQLVTLRDRAGNPSMPKPKAKMTIEELPKDPIEDQLAKVKRAQIVSLYTTSAILIASALYFIYRFIYG